MTQPISLDATSDVYAFCASSLPHFTPIQAQEGALLDVIKHLFKNRLSIEDDFAFECLWKQALANRSIQVGSWDLGTLRAVQRALCDTLIFHGPGIAAITGPTYDDGTPNQLYGFTRYILGRNDLPEEMTPKSVISLFYNHINGDLETTLPLLHREAREIFLRLQREEWPDPETPQGKLLKMFVGQMISIIPFFYPNGQNTFPIPVVIEGRWEVCDYNVERIELTPPPLSPLLAFGLTSARVGAPPLLTFSGTTWGEGRSMSLLTDFTPLMPVGRAAYLFGKSKIADWIQRQPQLVHLYGMSMGGAACVHTAQDFFHLIASVNVYNAPGLYYPSDPIDGPEFNIYVQENDFASNMGYFPSGSRVHVYRVIGEKLEGWLEAHTRLYGGGGRVTIIESSSVYENRRPGRKAFTALLILAGLTMGTVFWTFYLLACISTRPFLRQRSDQQRKIIFMND